MRNVDAEVTVLHVAPSSVTGAGGAHEAVRREFEEPGTEKQQKLPTVRFDVVHDASPVDAVLREAQKGYDLVIIGVSEEWGLESHLFGFRPERIAEQVDCSMLIVRKHRRAVSTTTTATTTPLKEHAIEKEPASAEQPFARTVTRRPPSGGDLEP
jgi:hypothetical protein